MWVESVLCCVSRRNELDDATGRVDSWLALTRCFRVWMCTVENKSTALPAEERNVSVMKSREVAMFLDSDGDCLKVRPETLPSLTRDRVLDLNS